MFQSDKIYLILLHLHFFQIVNAYLYFDQSFSRIKHFPDASSKLFRLKSLGELVFSSPTILYQPNKGIVGGHDVPIQHVPHQVALTIKRSYFCGGFIISENYVLTAAHCIQNVTPSELLLRAGSRWRRYGTKIPIAEVISHPQYDDPAYDKDVAVLRTVNPITFNDFIQPIELPPEGRPMVAGSMVQISGWGKTTASAKRGPDRLMAVQIPVVNFKQCKLIYLTVLTKNEWCGGHIMFGGKGPCQGDSGGAATQDGMAVGIVSFGRRCAAPLSPDVYSNIAAPDNREFITSVTGL